MRKKRTLSGHYLSALILLIITSVIVHSCKKDNRFNSDELPVTAELKQWFEMNKVSYSRFDGMEPIWETMYVNSQDSDKTVYELQLSNPKNIYQKIEGGEKNQMTSDKNFRLLIFKKNGSTEIAYGCYMSIVGNDPVKDGLSNIHYKQAGSFSGKIVFFQMDGTLANGWEYSKGSAIQRMSGIEPAFNKDIKLMSLPGFNTTTPNINLNKDKVMVPPPLACPIYSPVYGSTCVGVDGYMECSPYIAYYVCADPDNPVVGEYDGYGATHGGGYAGGGSQPNDISSELKDYPCAKALVDQLKSLNSDIGKLIKNTFNSNDLISIKYTPDPKLIGTKVDGKLLGSAVVGNTASYTIGINPDVLSNSTKEYILVTLYHEALHAYFAEKLRVLGLAEFNRQFTGVQVNGGRMLGVPNDDHIPMGYTKFVTGLRDAIKAFNPGFNTDRATALAECGIIQLTAAEANINNQERDVNIPGATGTKCPK